MNYSLIAIVGLLVIILVVFLVWKNRKDRKQLEKQIGNSDIKPEKHNPHKPQV